MLKTVLHPHCADGQEDGKEGDKVRPAPPWAAELKKKNRPLVVGMGTGARESNGKVSVTPFKNNSDKNNSPVVNAGLWTLALLCVLPCVCVCVCVSVCLCVFVWLLLFFGWVGCWILAV